MTTVVLSSEVLEALSSSAVSDLDDDCRSEFINIFLKLLKVDSHPQKENYIQHVEGMVKDHFELGLKDSSEKVRRSWISLAGATNPVEAELEAKPVETVTRSKDPEEVTLEAELIGTAAQVMKGPEETKPESERVGTAAQGKDPEETKIDELVATATQTEAQVTTELEAKPVRTPSGFAELVLVAAIGNSNVQTEAITALRRVLEVKNGDVSSCFV